MYILYLVDNKNEILESCVQNWYTNYEYAHVIIKFNEMIKKCIKIDFLPKRKLHRKNNEKNITLNFILFSSLVFLIIYFHIMHK
jgi:hypothetical protein